MNFGDQNLKAKTHQPFSHFNLALCVLHWYELCNFQCMRRPCFKNAPNAPLQLLRGTGKNFFARNGLRSGALIKSEPVRCTVSRSW
jgi:hypothetical protein